MLKTCQPYSFYSQNNIEKKEISWNFHNKKISSYFWGSLFPYVLVSLLQVFQALPYSQISWETTNPFHPQDSRHRLRRCKGRYGGRLDEALKLERMAIWFGWWWWIPVPRIATSSYHLKTQKWPNQPPKWIGCIYFTGIVGVVYTHHSVFLKGTQYHFPALEKEKHLQYMKGAGNN